MMISSVLIEFNMILFQSTGFYFVDSWIVLDMDNDYGKHDGLSICIYESLILDLHCNEMDFLAYPMDIQVSTYILNLLFMWS